MHGSPAGGLALGLFHHLTLPAKIAADQLVQLAVVRRVKGRELPPLRRLERAVAPRAQNGHRHVVLFERLAQRLLAALLPLRNLVVEAVAAGAEGALAHAVQHAHVVAARCLAELRPV